jgi:hypothetical protein
MRKPDILEKICLGCDFASLKLENVDGNMLKLSFTARSLIKLYIYIVRYRKMSLNIEYNKINPYRDPLYMFL